MYAPHRDKPIDILEPYEVWEMCDVVSETGTLTGIRDAALISFLFCSGLRISEALSVTPSDLSTRAGNQLVNVRYGRGGKQGWSVLMPDRGQLDRWIEARSSLPVSDGHPLFCTISQGVTKTPGTKQDRKTVAARLKRIAQKAGIAKRVHCHVFRHSHAVELFSQGASVAAIQQQLRHAHPTTTEEYLMHLGCVDSARVLAGLKWG